MPLWGSAESSSPLPQCPPTPCARGHLPLKPSAVTAIRWKAHDLISLDSKASVPTEHLHLAQQGLPEVSQSGSGGGAPQAPEPLSQRPHQGLKKQHERLLYPQSPKPTGSIVQPEERGVLEAPAPGDLAADPPSPAPTINSQPFCFMTPNFSKPNSSFHHYLSHRSH